LHKCLNVGIKSEGMKIFTAISVGAIAIAIPVMFNVPASANETLYLASIGNSRAITSTSKAVLKNAKMQQVNLRAANLNGTSLINAAARGS
jgi:hypothetical protein